MRWGGLPMWGGLPLSPARRPAHGRRNGAAGDRAGVSKGDMMNGRSIFRRMAPIKGKTPASRGRALLSIPAALGALAALAVAASAGTSPAAAAATRAGVSAAAQVSHPGQAGQARPGPAALPGEGLVAGSWRKLPAAPV